MLGRRRDLPPAFVARRLCVSQGVRRRVASDFPRTEEPSRRLKWPASVTRTNRSGSDSGGLAPRLPEARVIGCLAPDPNIQPSAKPALGFDVDRVFGHYGVPRVVNADE